MRKPQLTKSGKKFEKWQAWQVTKVKSKKGVIDKVPKEGRTDHVATLMNLCQLKHSELEQQFQTYRGRVVLRGDDVKDDSGSYAVLTEQDSSASHMTAQKFCTLLPDYVDTQVKIEDAPTLLILPNSQCPNIWIRLPRYKWQKTWHSIEEHAVLLERNLYRHSLQVCCGRGSSKRS